MRSKKVTRYYCEFCKKSGCSAPHMSRHERGCTNNPARVCGVCRVMELDSKPLNELIAFCKAKGKPGESVDGNPDDSSLWLSKEDTSGLRDLACGCSVCMLAALRQSDVYADSSFNMKEELKALWADHNNSQYAREVHYG